MAKSYKVTVIAGTKVVADMAKNVLDATIEASIQVKTVAGGASSATPTILAPGPAGQNRKMEDVVGWFVNGTADEPPIAVGEPWEAPAGFKNTNWWDGTTWSLGSSVELPVPEGVDVIDPVGEKLPKEKAVAEYVTSELKEATTEVNANIDLLWDDVNKNILSRGYDNKQVPTLTMSQFINSSGTTSVAADALWGSSGYIAINSARSLVYKGRFGLTGTRMAFYSSNNTSSFISSYPATNTDIRDLELTFPVGTKFIRVSCYDPSNNDFHIILKGYKLNNLQDFRIIGTPTYDTNGVISSANIVWNDGSTGVVTYNNWNATEFAYAGFTATSVENGVNVIQPAVTWNDQGQITNYPNTITSFI